MNTSRYSRAPQQANAENAKPATTTPGETAGTPIHAGQASGSTAEYQALIKRLDELRDRRRRHEYELDRSEREVAECKAQAEALGVHSLEELEALVERQEAEDREAIAKFQAALDAEEALLNEVDERLADTQGS